MAKPKIPVTYDNSRLITSEYRQIMADINKNNYEVSFDCLSGEHGKCTWSIGMCPCKCHTENK